MAINTATFVTEHDRADGLLRFYAVQWRDPTFARADSLETRIRILLRCKLVNGALSFKRVYATIGRVFTQMSRLTGDRTFLDAWEFTLYRPTSKVWKGHKFCAASKDNEKLTGAGMILRVPNNSEISAMTQ